MKPHYPVITEGLTKHTASLIFNTKELWTQIAPNIASLKS